jgi:hypothetical protein
MEERPESSVEVDRAIRRQAAEVFLRLGKASSLADGYRALDQILKGFGNGKLTLSGHHPRRLLAMPVGPVAGTPLCPGLKRDFWGV